MSDKNIKTISGLMFKDKTYEETKSMDFIDIVCNINNRGDYSVEEFKGITLSRSNFFRVSDIEKLKEIAKKTNSKVIEKDEKVSLIHIADDKVPTWKKGCVDYYYNKDIDGFLTIHEEIQDILLEDEKAIFIEFSNSSNMVTFVTNATMVTTEAITSHTNMRIDMMELIEKEFIFFE